VRACVRAFFSTAEASLIFAVRITTLQLFL